MGGVISLLFDPYFGSGTCSCDVCASSENSLAHSQPEELLRLPDGLQLLQGHGRPKMNTELSEYVICKSDPMSESLKFVVNVHIKLGLEQETYAPNSFFQGDIVSSMAEGWLEMQEAFVSTLDILFIDSSLLIYRNGLARHSRSI